METQRGGVKDPAAPVLIEIFCADDVGSIVVLRQVINSKSTGRVMDLMSKAYGFDCQL